MCDGNLAALAQYEREQEKEELAYEELLNTLRESDPDDWEDIINSMGWGDADLTIILGDI